MDQPFASPTERVMHYLNDEEIAGCPMGAVNEGRGCPRAPRAAPLPLQIANTAATDSGGGIAPFTDDGGAVDCGVLLDRASTQCPEGGTTPVLVYETTDHHRHVLPR